MEIRKIKAEEYDQMVRIVQDAYAGSFQGTEDERERVKDVLMSMTTIDDTTALGAYENDVLMGSVLHFTFTTNFHGEMIKTAGIGMLAVDLLHKKKGVAKALLQHSIDLAKMEHIELYHLYPFNSRFYRNFGFGYGAPVYTYCIAPADFTTRGDKRLLRYANKEDYPKMFALYDGKAQRTHGMSLKSNSDKKRLDKMKSGRILVAEKEGQMIGYMIYSQKGLNPANNQSQKLVVAEMIYTHHDALLAFADFFHGQREQIDYIEIATFNERFHHLLCNTKFVPEPKTLDIISLKAADMALGLMPLALNPQKLLDRLASRCEEDVTFVIERPRLEAIHGRIGTGEHLVRLSINDFSSWINGIVKLSELYEMGQLTCTMPEVLKRMDRQLYLSSPQSYTRF